MNVRLCWIVLVVFVGILAGCVAPPPNQAPPPASPPEPVALTPAEIVTAVGERFSAGDLDGGMAYWADDAVWYIFGLPPTGFEMIVGKDALRTEFENEIAAHLTWEIDPISVVGKLVTSHDKTWLDFTREIGVAPVEATGQYLIEDGKIVEYTWTPTEDSVTRLMAALAEVMPPEPEAEAPVLEAVSELTVTFANDTCAIAEPVALQSGDIQLTVDVQDDSKEAYAVTFMTLAEGKTFMDLMASTVGMPPAWSNLLHYEEVGPASVKTYAVTIGDGPVYAICWARPPDHPVGNFGPLTVVGAPAESKP